MIRIVLLYALVIATIGGAYTSFSFRILVVGFALGWLANMAKRGLMRVSGPVTVIGPEPLPPAIATAWRRRKGL